MNEAVQRIVEKHQLAKKILLLAEKVGRAPMRRDENRYEEVLLEDLKKERARLIYAQMKQDRDLDIASASKLGFHTNFLYLDFPESEDDPKIVEKARLSVEDDIAQIKRWIDCEPCLQGKVGDELVNAAVEFFHKFREK